MTDTRKRRPSAALVRREPTEPTKRATSDRDSPLAFVIPDIVTMLQQVKAIVGSELTIMQTEGRTDSSGQKIRNLAATLASVQSSEKDAVKDEELAGLTSQQLARKLRKEADLLEGITHDDE